MFQFAVVVDDEADEAAVEKAVHDAVLEVSGVAALLSDVVLDSGEEE